MNEIPHKSHPFVRGIERNVRERAKELRREMTPAEKMLWDELRAGKLNGLKFRRQHAIGNFILDFYCSSCKLGIEIDGDVHDGQSGHDAERTRMIAEYNYHIIRFKNEEVLHDIAVVLFKITAAAHKCC